MQDRMIFTATKDENKRCTRACGSSFKKGDLVVESFGSASSYGGVTMRWTHFKCWLTQQDDSTLDLFISKKFRDAVKKAKREKLLSEV